MYLNATVNRELEQKVKCISGLTNHKMIVRNDLRLITRIVDNMDRRWGLWGYVSCYSNNKIVDDKANVETGKKSKSKSKKKDENEESEAKKEEISSQQQQETSMQMMNEENNSQISLEKNPLIEEARQLLKNIDRESESTKNAENQDEGKSKIDNKESPKTNNNESKLDHDYSDKELDVKIDDDLKSEEDLKGNLPSNGKHKIIPKELSKFRPNFSRIKKGQFNTKNKKNWI